MNGEALPDRSMFARAPGSIRVVDEESGAKVIAGRLECLMCRDDALVLVRAFLDVRLDEELPPRQEEAAHLVQERVAHDEPLGVTLLPPRVREVEKEAANAAV